MMRHDTIQYDMIRYNTIYFIVPLVKCISGNGEHICWEKTFCTWIPKHFQLAAAHKGLSQSVIMTPWQWSIFLYSFSHKPPSGNMTQHKYQSNIPDPFQWSSRDKGLVEFIHHLHLCLDAQMSEGLHGTITDTSSILSLSHAQKNTSFYHREIITPPSSSTLLPLSLPLSLCFSLSFSFSSNLFQIFSFLLSLSLTCSLLHQPPPLCPICLKPPSPSTPPYTGSLSLSSV